MADNADIENSNPMSYSQLKEESLTLTASSSSTNGTSTRASRAKKKSTKAVERNSLSEPLTGASEPDQNGDDHQWDESIGGDAEMGLGQHANGGSGGAVMDDDPFYVFREDLLRKLGKVDEGLSRYLRLVHTTDTAANTHEVKDAKKQLKRHIKNAESTLKDLQMTVRLVENKRDKFLHIDDAELYDRRTLVQTSRDRITKAKQDMNSDDVKAKIMTDERAMALRRSGGDMGARTDNERENTAFIADSQAKASLMMQQQDETLEELDEAVTRVGYMAGTINEELGQQNKMLTELEDDLADAEEKLGLVMGKLAKLLKTKNKCQLGTIVALCLVVIVLFFLVLYV